MAIKKKQIYEVKITDMAFGGKGVTKVDGFTIFVDQTVPMDHALIRIIKKKKNYAEAKIVELLSPSPYRIEAACEYSGFCGGCKWQFIEYEKQLEYKRQHVIDSLEHIGMINDVPVHLTIPSKKNTEYRNKMEFSCSDRRWLLPDELGNDDIDTGFALGLHVPGTFYKVLDINACLLQSKLGNRILNDTRAFMKQSSAPVYGLRSHEGFWRFLMLRYSNYFDQWMVNMITSAEDQKIVQPLADLLTAKYPEVISVVNNITSSKAGIAVGEYEICLAGEAKITDRIGSFDFEISANSFFQTNTLGAEQLYEIVKNYAGLTGSETVADLYSGTGTIAIYLSGSAKEITGIECVESSVKDAEKNCAKNHISNCRFIRGDIAESISLITEKPDVLVIDPPRVGMHKSVVKQIIDMGTDRIVYVSCNPSTLARDISLMKDHYNVLEIQPVDMFPHTYHIEAVARLERK